MKLTRYSDYALRIGLYLAVHRDRLVSVGEIAETYDLPRGNVMKLVTDLVNAGFFTSVRGRSGGVRLARPADQISIGALVAFTEGNQPLVDCAHCLIAPQCSLICIMKEARAAFFGVLGKYSLQDVQDNTPGITALLSVPQPG
ncbi:RrF2 family transcriptional regulator [Actibacterium ureilyticum]|uniref:RrF2 family transcriptional regulator n=1 Tax=Actibacterium ureilyticum TaxID=1590614 RepID=UPI000BAB2308|nr:Rrf2 family transcriptional regulator [Actibacterium ureilyticum]